MPKPSNSVTALSRALRLPDVTRLLGVSRATVWRKVKSDSSFPKPFHLSDRITCWDEAEIRGWISHQMARRSQGS